MISVLVYVYFYYFSYSIDFLVRKWYLPSVYIDFRSKMEYKEHEGPN